MPTPIDCALVATTDQIPGYEIVRSFGVAEGLGVSIVTGFLPGGQQGILMETMREAFLNMMTSAAAQGANAIVGLRYTTPSSDHERVILAYGTAVKVRKT